MDCAATGTVIVITKFVQFWKSDFLKIPRNFSYAVNYFIIILLKYS